MRYRNILFDLYGTLIDIRTDEEDPRFWERIAQYYTEQGAAYSPAELRQTYLDLIVSEKKKAADPDFSEVELRCVFALLYQRKHKEADTELIEETAAFFRLNSLHRLGLYPGTKELLTSLREQGCRLFLLSNAQSCFTRRELAICGIENAFERIFLSSDYLCSKPSPLFFDVPFKECGLKKEETVMIGNDACSDIFGARSYGIDAIYVHTAISPPLKEIPDVKLFVGDGDLFKVKKFLCEE